MGDLCKQCSVDIFGEDFGDMKGIGGGGTLEEGEGWRALCEGCGPTVVDDEGRCVCPTCLKKHGAINGHDHEPEGQVL